MVQVLILDNLGWYSSNNGKRWDIFCNNCPRSYDSPITNINAIHNDGTGSDPNIITNSNGMNKTRIILLDKIFWNKEIFYKNLFTRTCNVLVNVIYYGRWLKGKMKEKEDNALHSDNFFLRKEFGCWHYRRILLDCSKCRHMQGIALHGWRRAKPIASAIRWFRKVGFLLI